MQQSQEQVVEAEVVGLLARSLTSALPAERDACERKLLVHVGLARETSLGRLAVRVINVLGKREYPCDQAAIPGDERPFGLPELADWAFPGTIYPRWFTDALIEKLRDEKLAVGAAMVLRIGGEASDAVLAELGDMQGIPALAQQVLTLRAFEAPHDETGRFTL